MTAAELAHIIESLLFLSSEPVKASELIEATEASELEVRAALDLLAEDLAPGKRGLVLKEIGGGYLLATDPAAEVAARRLLAKPKTPPLTQAQAETLAIVAYLQPVTRPE
ncbi:MAG: SMC-Scp complex subunit ScpB, partial [Solirubrobacterales bacterium]